MKPAPITYDVTQGHSHELGRCVVVSSTYADGIAFEQKWMTPAVARALGYDLIEMAAQCKAETAVATGLPTKKAVEA